MHFAMRGTVLMAVVVTASGCGGSKVMMPARMDLGTFQRIGMVEFSSNADGNLQSLASQEFIQRMQSAQPGIPVLELGNEKRVLHAIGRDKLDSDALQAVAEKYKVDAVIVGNLEVTGVTPKVSLSQILT